MQSKQYIVFLKVEHSLHVHPGILSIIPAQTHSLGIAIFSK